MNVDEIRASPGSGAHPPGRSARPVAGIGFDWIVTGFSLWFIGGLYLDGWAHLHAPHLETFFTPWHAVLYSGFLAVATVLVVTGIRNRAAGYIGWAMPAGYELSLLGAAIFAVGGVGDMIWHTLFGIEVDLDALLSPTHLVLALGGILMGTGPLRAAWRRLDNGAEGLASKMPMLVSLALMLSVFTFFTQYVHPFGATIAATSYRPATLYRPEVRLDVTDGQLRVVAPVPGSPAVRAGLRPGDRIVQIDGQTTEGLSARQVSALIRGEHPTPVRLTLIRDSAQLAVVLPRERLVVEEIGFWRQAAGISGILLETGLLMGLILLAVRRWTLPLGSLTLIVGLNALLMTLMRDFALSTGPYPLIAVALLGGLAGDLLVWQLKPSESRPAAFRAFAFAMPTILYALYFLALVLTGAGIWWSLPFWSGAVVLAGVVGWLLSYLIIPPNAEKGRELRPPLWTHGAPRPLRESSPRTGYEFPP